MRKHTVHIHHEEPDLVVDIHIPYEWDGLSNSEVMLKIIERFESFDKLVRKFPNLLTGHD